MNRRRQDVCRDFQRGSCRYGANCKFLHPQPEPQAPPEHICNDPRNCLKKIKEDVINEKPVYWRLTCYAHWKHRPNDINGDTSFEELRAAAYEFARQGISLSDIASRENMLRQAKEAEFDALQRGPYKGPAPLEYTFSSPETTIFGRPVPVNSPVSQIFGVGGASQIIKQDNSGGFGHGPVSTPGFSYGVMGASQIVKQDISGGFGNGPALTPPGFPSVNQPFPSFHSPNNLFSPSPPNMQSPFPSFASFNFQQANVSPLPSVSSRPPANPEEHKAWLSDEWELGQIPEEEPPVSVR